MRETGYLRTENANGIRILTEKMPHLRSVTTGFWVGVGSRDEPQELSGISHFIEHLLFKGTERRSARRIAEEFDAIGGELNAFSAKEYTCYYAKVLDENLGKAMDIMVDMLLNSRLSPKDVDAERKVILEEIAMHEDSPDDIIHDLFVSALWESHPLGQSVLGSQNVIRTLQSTDIREFFDRYYYPENIVVAVAGNVEHEDIVDMVERLMAVDGGRGRHVRHSVVPEIRPHTVVYDRPTEQAHIVLGTQGLPRRHPARFALAVLDNILGGGMSSRLFQKIREERSLVYSIFSYHSMYAETGLWAVYAGTSPENAPAVMELIKQEIDLLLEKGVSGEELERAKGHIKGSLVLSLEDSGSRMTRLGKAEISGGEILTLDELLKRVEEVTLDDVQRLANEIFGSRRLVAVIIGPFGDREFQAHLF
ncbi:pitrilysin family protein [Candidatus Solincola tengchongensis]|uniref:M16 family metallopeptidase n=1 Tax=Candidatus Solincola tengchongensis TaxID=2900693 RepID=UPI002580145B|nr:pitrilysin family protein [Candidatus Solincola tengchongensis]